MHAAVEYVRYSVMYTAVIEHLSCIFEQVSLLVIIWYSLDNAVWQNIAKFGRLVKVFSVPTKEAVKEWTMIDWVSIVRHSRRRFSNYMYAVPSKVRKKRRPKRLGIGQRIDPGPAGVAPFCGGCCWVHKVS